MRRARAFDAYGTLFDVHSAVARNATSIGPQAERLSELWRSRQLEYTWVLNGIGAYDDFWTSQSARLTQPSVSSAVCPMASRATARRLCRALGLSGRDAHLRALKGNGETVILFSNATIAMLN